MESKQKAAVPSSPHLNKGHPTTPTTPPSESSVPLPRSAPSAPTRLPAAPPEAPPKRTSSPSIVTKPTQTEPLKMLYIGDSISSNVDIGALELATQTKFFKTKAYSSIHDTESNVAKQAAKYPESNFTDVITTELNKEEYDCLILQSGSVDITNLNTKDEPSKYTEYFKQVTVMSATNLFKLMQPTMH